VVATAGSALVLSLVHTQLAGASPLMDLLASALAGGLVYLAVLALYGRIRNEA
jgi:hypothetical protein